jgi:pectate lyase
MLSVVIGWTSAFAESVPSDGYGSETLGGELGATVVVTSLVDDGSGSLREAIAGGNRNVVFAVAGDIVVSSALYLESYTTVDGATAPDPGITIRPASGYDGNLLEIDGNDFGVGQTHDIVVSHLRVDGSGLDNLRIEQGAYNIVIDHCSFRGALDGNIDISDGCHDITIQWCILAGAVKNSLIRDGCDSISLHHNLYVNGDERNPQIQAGCTNVDMVNNVVYGWAGNYGTRFRTGSGGNLVANVFAPSARSDVADAAVITDDTSVYVEGNLVPEATELASTSPERWPAPDVGQIAAILAFVDVMDGAGAYPRDAIDAAFAASVVYGATPLERTSWSELKLRFTPIPGI